MPVPAALFCAVYGSRSSALPTPGGRRRPSRWASPRCSGPGCCSSLLISPEQLPEAAALAQRCPTLPVVVDHLANAARPGTDLAAWRRALTQLARAPLAVAKLSGLGTDEGTAVTLAGDARAVLGADRLLWGSDWPVLLLRDDYRGERARLDRLLAGWTPAERAAVLGGTAARVYGTLR